MRKAGSTPEMRLFAAVACAAFGLVCAIAVGAANFDNFAAEFLAPRRWLLLALGVGLNYAALALMTKFPGPRAVAVLVGYALVVFATLAAGWRWGQLGSPLAFWIADIWGMVVTHAVALFLAARRKAVQPDVQSSFLASRLWK